MNITFNNRDPVYLQVVRHFKEEMATGKLAAGQEIASRRELAGLLQINPNTVQRAYKEMEEQHLITTAGNSPSRITTDKQVLNSIRQELIQEAVEVFIQSIKKIELPTDDLLRFVKEKYEAERAREVKE